jgi:uncharacterized protein YbaA (DUF1428 family)
MPQYVDGFVIVVPKKNIEDYKKLAKKAGKVWLEHGALEYRECIGEDLKVDFGLPFPKLVGGLKPSEAIIFSWITYKSRKQRDIINAKVMNDDRLASMSPESMPFDMKRMSCGGFETFVKF